jgi:hypothetical protein
MTDSWNPFNIEGKDNAEEDGAEIARGSEGGRIVCDEEHLLGARITLEKNCEVAPFAITCGIYGWMMHTRFLSEECEAVEQYEAMKLELADLLGRAEALASDEEKQRAVLMEGCERFVERFP